MLFASLIARMKDRAAKRAKYLQIVKQIDDLSDRDLADIRGNRDEMRRHASLEVYGQQANA
jgi:hypothetical protein